MVSFRFPFSFSQPPRPSHFGDSNRRFFSAIAAFPASAAAVAASAVGVGLAIHSHSSKDSSFLGNAVDFLASNGNALFPMWGSISLSENVASVSESRTGTSFPSVVRDNQRLLGVGLRRKAILGLKNIDVYAFGVYADDADLAKCLGEKYGSISAAKLKGNEGLKHDVMESDISMTIRLQIVYGRLSIRSVRSAFEESVGSRLQKFSGSDNKELLQRFTSQFKDEYRIPKGSIIDLSREPGYVLRTTIDGEDIGSIESKLLCRSILDLYIGEEPFDCKAKEEVDTNLASLVGK